jgi:hypothetical protein
LFGIKNPELFCKYNEATMLSDYDGSVYFSSHFWYVCTKYTKKCV